MRRKRQENVKSIVKNGKCLEMCKRLCAKATEVDLSEQEWALLEPLIPPAKLGGRPRTTYMREVVHAILYLDRTGWKFRALPHEYPRLFDRLELLSQVAQ
jgi:hypothetical protein